jgi:phosphoribosylformylglycinamidine synthase II
VIAKRNPVAKARGRAKRRKKASDSRKQRVRKPARKNAKTQPLLKKPPAKAAERSSSGARAPRITPALVAAHGIATQEYERIRALIGRTPSFTELGIFSAMWNEHCSYKSSKLHLRSLPTQAPWVIQGPGENAGVIDIGDGLAVVFKMESHNHPSYIEPYEGAATGVGGILRDVFTMGARPIACLNALFFGAPSHPRTRHLVSGVAAGVGGYGNSFGVPTVGGSVCFHTRYNGNCLVNAMAVGIAERNKIFYAAASGIGMPIVYLGSKTGRDGIHGASMASAQFADDAEEKRPTVQVGDPFAEKLLLEACLEIMAQDCVIAIQDMGAAGLTCSAVEMGAKGNLGVTLDLDRVPCRESGMTAYEMMLSESQERMLMVLKPEKEAQAEAIFRKWGLDFAVVGETTPTKRFIVRHAGAVVADLPIKELGDEAPVYDRAYTQSERAAPLRAADIDPPVATVDALLRLLGSADLCSKRWVWEQYDHVIMGNTVQRPGGDAAVVRVDGSAKALAFTTDVTPRYCEADPFEGGKQAVAEAWRNLSAVGAKPMAVTDNLNFGNPERPEIMGQLVACIRGIAEACKALDCPVVSGNVSLYNETSGRSILPTPTIGAVGLLDDFRKSATLAFKAADEAILLIGETTGWLGQSLYLREICEQETGAPPPVDLQVERRHGEFVRALIAEGIATAAHDVSDGGLLVAICEMAMASGIGAELERAPLAAHAFWFGEDQGRYVVTVSAARAERIIQRGLAASVPMRRLGLTGGDALTLEGERPILVAKLQERFEAWLPGYMAGAAG